MRLVRRSLLCLVVGVAAFGAAGWLRRPRPAWTVDVGDIYAIVPTAPPALDPHPPIWIAFHGSHPSFGGLAAATTVECRDAAAGRLLRRVEGCVGDKRVNAKGELVVACPAGGDGAPGTTIRLLAPMPAAAPRTVDLGKGRWSVNDGARHALAAKLAPGGFMVTVADLETGEVAGRST